MTRRYVSAISMASLYGNPSLDAKSGSKDTMEAVREAFSTLDYVEASKKTGRTLERQVNLFNAIKKSLSKDDISKEYDRIVGDKREEQHILGGTSRRKLVRIAK